MPGDLFHTTPISEAAATSGFRSGVHALDDFLRRHALANEGSGIGRTYVLASSKPELPPILGFYTLSMAGLAPEMASIALGSRLPRYPIPVALIGRLAVDERARGHGFGEVLLFDAFRRIVGASAMVGCAGIIVDAKTEAAERFYLKYDFLQVEFGEWPRRMVVAVARVKAALVLSGKHQGPATSGLDRP